MIRIVSYIISRNDTQHKLFKVCPFLTTGPHFKSAYKPKSKKELLVD